MIKCETCKEREAIVEYCDSWLSYSHGYKTWLCRQCYIKKIEKIIRTAQDNLKEQKKLLKEELKGGKNKDE